MTIIEWCKVLYWCHIHVRLCCSSLWTDSVCGRQLYSLDHVLPSQPPQYQSVSHQGTSSYTRPKSHFRLYQRWLWRLHQMCWLSTRDSSGSLSHPSVNVFTDQLNGVIRIFWECEYRISGISTRISNIRTKCVDIGHCQGEHGNIHYQEAQITTNCNKFYSLYS